MPRVNMNEIRARKIESLITHKVGDLILSGEIKDHRVTSSLSITHVNISNDLEHAKIYISSYEGEQAMAKGVQGLNHASGFLQRRIGRELKLRTIPKFHFFEDTSIRDGMAINQKIDALFGGSEETSGEETDS